MNLAKLTQVDLPIFNGVIGDLFPGVDTPVSDYGEVCLNFHTFKYYFLVCDSSFFYTNVYKYFLEHEIYYFFVLQYIFVLKHETFKDSVLECMLVCLIYVYSSSWRLMKS